MSDAEPSFPISVRISAGIWLIYSFPVAIQTITLPGGILVQLFIEDYHTAFGYFIIWIASSLIGISTMRYGLRVLRGKTHSIRRFAVMLILVSVPAHLAAMYNVFIGFPGSCQPQDSIIIFGVVGPSLTCAGILALIGASHYDEWRKSQADQQADTNESLNTSAISRQT